MPVDSDLYRVRDTIADETIRDLIGPPSDDDVRPDEAILTEAPLQRYVAGMLFPQSAGPDDHLPAEVDVDVVDDDGGAESDPPISLSSVRYPSAMGCSFAVDVAVASELQVSVRSARYHSLDDAGGEAWKREPIALTDPIRIPLGVEESGRTLPIIDGLGLYYKVRELQPDGVRSVTLSLVNELVQPADQFRKDANTFFQVGLGVEAAGAAAFVDRSDGSGRAADEDARSYALMYRHLGTFASGHGCSVVWSQVEESPPRANLIRTTFAPSQDVRLADSNRDIRSEFFSMRRLAEEDISRVIPALNKVLSGYDRWIDGLVAEGENLPSGALRETARDHIKDCRAAATRMRGGVNLLETDPHAWTAFQLMNAAMLRQRAQTVWLADGAKGAPDTDTDQHEWRPFQIAFILLNLQGIIDPTHDDRQTVDLLWFPTGGGKTEAYLGLIAFTVFRRRLTSDGLADGLTVIMRYTLRLLTLQQYQRALLLICACEAIRRTNQSTLGEAEISIGLWVGGKAAPNNHKDAKKALEAHKSGASVSEGDPVQIKQCPWCGTELDHSNYWIRDNKRMVVLCRQEGCEFRNGLPAFLVDEDVYRFRPTLMIATVDKFASLPWRDNMGDLFGMSSATPPPELIIQDELHLITGPLGTLVGLYETAIELLCESVDGHRPKIIASTATIRRASAQIKRLYAREGFQFPPPGLDARSSYFATEVGPEEKGSRRYVGLLAPATSHASLLVRAYAGILQTASDVDADDKQKDPYWTLVGYFNSLRVLGAAVLQVRDDVPDRAEVLAQRNGTEPRFELTPEYEELTSRKTGGEIPDVLRQMEIQYPSDDALDVILATNMISVGMDINRLGLMVVMGQPQSASEYIQSTSRVGRQHPGLVVVLFNASRSRDRSHYESFTSFHQALYRQVDASSVTPFAARARDRGLHAVLVGLIRASESRYRTNGAASNVAQLRETSQPYMDRILDRVARVAPEELLATRESMNEFLDDWIRRAEQAPDLVFSDPRNRRPALLADASRPGLNPEAPSTLWSLRDVDTESNLFLRKG